eukprot:g13975.t1
MVGCDLGADDGGTKPASDSPTADRVTLEIKGAQLNAAVRNALRRKRSHERPQPQGLDNNDAHHGDMSHRSGGSRNNRSEGSSGEGSSAGSNSRDAGGSSKEAAFLKAAVESLRAGLREKEDIVTELEREKEGLLEKVASLEPATQDNVKLSQKVAQLEAQIDRLEAKLRQADNERSLTMSLVDTLKSAQDDLRAAHAQVSQRYADLENTAEDSAEAVRRGNVLLHSQQLKIDAQSRQVKRQEEELVSLRQERELQLAKADEHAAELAQVLRRESAGKSSIADSQAEVEELKGELGLMREAFGRHRDVMRKNQGVIDAHEKTLRDVRSELLSLTLEAERQSARHLQASAHASSELARVTVERNTAVRESGALRIEKEALKDKLEEAGRKLDEVRSTASATAATATSAGPRDCTKFRGRHQNHTLQPQHQRQQQIFFSGRNHDASPQGVPSDPPPPEPAAHPDNPEPLANNSDGSGRQGWSNNAEDAQQHQTYPLDAPQGRTSVARCSSGMRRGNPTDHQPERDHSSLRRPRHQDAPTATKPEKSPSSPSSASSIFHRSSAAGDVPPPTGAGAATDDDPPSSLNRVGANNKPPSGPASTPSLVWQVSSASPTTSAADAGGGGGGGRRGEPGADCESGGGGGGGGGVGGTTRIFDSSRNPHHAIAGCPEDHRPEEAEGKTGVGGGGDDGTADGAAASAARRSRPRSPSTSTSSNEEAAPPDADDGTVPVPAKMCSSPASSVGSRKRVKTTAVAAHARCDAGGSPANGGGGKGAAGRLCSPPVPRASAPQRPTILSVGNGGAREEDVVRKSDDGSPDDGVCPSCGDTPYGLMINCRGCNRQYHSSCAPEGQKVGKGLGAVFHCSKCRDDSIWGDTGTELRRAGSPCLVASRPAPDGVGSSTIRHLATWIYAEQMGCDWVTPDWGKEHVGPANETAEMYCHRAATSEEMDLSKPRTELEAMRRCSVVDWLSYFQFDAPSMELPEGETLEYIDEFALRSTDGILSVLSDLHRDGPSETPRKRLVFTFSPMYPSRQFLLSTSSWDERKWQTIRRVLEQARANFHRHPRPRYSEKPKCGFGPDRLHFAVHVRLGDRREFQDADEEYFQRLQLIMDTVTAEVVRRELRAPLFHVFSETLAPCPSEETGLFDEFPTWPVRMEQIQECSAAPTPDDCPEKQAGRWCSPAHDGIFKIVDKKIVLHVGSDVQNALSCMIHADGILMGCSTFGQMAGVLTKGISMFSVQCDGPRTPAQYKLIPPFALAERGNLWVPVAGSWRDPALISTSLFAGALDTLLAGRRLIV